MEKTDFLNAVTKMEADIREEYARNAKVFPCYVNRASEIGHPCERYLFFQRTAYALKSLPSEKLMEIFEGGRAIEDLCEDELKKAGYKVIEGQRPYMDEKHQISGHIDGKVKILEQNCPIEIKGINEHAFKNLKCVDDFLKSGKSWLMKYPAQLLIYLYLDNSANGILYLKSKSLAEFKAIPIILYDYLDYVESLLKKADRINEAVSKKEKPKQIPYSDYICGYCDFLTTCLPDKEGIELDFIDNPELEADLKRYMELKPGMAEYDKLDKHLSACFKGRDRLVIGNFIVTGASVHKEPYAVAGGDYWKKTIKSII
jgi:hypothetical protein